MVLVAAVAQAHSGDAAAVADFSAGPGSGNYSLVSSTPRTLVDALTFRDRRTSAAIPAAEVGAISKANCAATGATVEGDRKSREVAASAVDAFLKQVFKL
jgi:hypothetical protein